jgi:hypothetical protein
MTRNALGFASVGLTPNQIATKLRTQGVFGDTVLSAYRGERMAGREPERQPRFRRREPEKLSQHGSSNVGPAASEQSKTRTCPGRLSKRRGREVTSANSRVSQLSASANAPPLPQWRFSIIVIDRLGRQIAGGHLAKSAADVQARGCALQPEAALAAIKAI